MFTAVNNLINFWVFTLLISVFIEKVTFSSITMCRCGETFIDPRILAGRDAKESRYPWVVALVTKTGEFACASALISNFWLLTVAHCFDLFKKEELIANLASTRWNVTGVERRIAQTISPQEFAGFPTHHHDIALAKLDEPVTFTDSLMPICFPGPTTKTVSEYYTTVGWGQMEDDYPSVLQEVEVESRSDEHCTFWWKEESFNSTLQLCAGRDRGSCIRDYGSPLMFRYRGKYVLAGITAYGYYPCGTPLYPGVYTRLTYYKGWIESKLNGPARDLCYW